MHKSHLDSDRFNLNIHRGVLSNFNIDEIRDYIECNQLDILILRVDSAIKDQQSELFSLVYPTIHCDTLVYYELDLKSHNPRSLKNDLNFEEINSENRDVITELVPQIFNNYKNHYSSNPYLDKRDIIDGYIQWANEYTTNEQTGKISWLVRDSKNEIIGFATCSYNDETYLCEGVLYGIVPTKSGGGIYGDLIRFTQNYFKEKGFLKMIVSTQVQNYAVQKVWSREGFHMNKCYDTYHINAFLGESNTSVEKKIKFRFEGKEIQQINTEKKNDSLEILAYPNEMNLVDNGYSLRLQLEKELSSFLHLEWPDLRFFSISSMVTISKELYNSKNYTLILKCIRMKVDKEREFVSLIKDDNNRTVSVSYINFQKK
jgi:hypothetical protein